MRTGIFRQGYGKPSQGLQLRGSNLLTQGLIAFTPFPDGCAREGSSNITISHKTIDLSPYPYVAQWQPGGSGIGAGGIPLPENSPWGLAERFGLSADEWLLYQANQPFLDNFPTGNAPRTLSALIRRNSTTNPLDYQIIQSYGGDIGNHGGGELFALGYSQTRGGASNLFLEIGGLHQVFAPFPLDGGWHLVSLVYPTGFSLNTDVIFYIDGMVVPASSANFSGPVNTFIAGGRNDWAYAIGNINLAFGAGTSDNNEFQGLIGGTWVWNRPLNASEQNAHWRDPFQMIARPRNLTAIVFIAAAPTCNLSASFTTIFIGGSTQLQWTTFNNPTSASIDNGIGAVNPAGGVLTVSPTVTTTYILTVTNAGGSNTCQVTITVIPLSCTISSLIGAGVVTLTWSIIGTATSASIDNGIGAVSTSGGSVTIPLPSITTIYQLTVSGPGGTSHCQTTVVVSPSVCTPVACNIEPGLSIHDETCETTGS